MILPSNAGPERQRVSTRELQPNRIRVTLPSVSESQRDNSSRTESGGSEVVQTQTKTNSGVLIQPAAYAHVRGDCCKCLWFSGPDYVGSELAQTEDTQPTVNNNPKGGATPYWRPLPGGLKLLQTRCRAHLAHFYQTRNKTNAKKTPRRRRGGCTPQRPAAGGAAIQCTRRERLTAW
jgi:hypothetical protein